MGLTKVLAGVTGAVIVVAGVAAVAIQSRGGNGTPEKPVSARSSVSSTVVAPVANGVDPAATSGVSAATGAPASPSNGASTGSPAAQANPGVPVPTAGVAGATSTPSAQDVLNSVTALMNQLKQSASANGQPQTLTPEQVNAAINDQLAKLGIKP